jgi:hypothetical protein
MGPQRISGCFRLSTWSALTLSDDDLAASACCRLRVSSHPDLERPVRCECGAALSRTKSDHFLVCPRFVGATTARHNVLQQAWCRVVFCNGVATSIEPVYAQLAPPGRVPLGARGNVLFATTRDLVVRDSAVVHPGGNTLVERAAFPAGHAADFRARRKRARAPATDAAFVPLVQETYGRVHHDANPFLKDLVSRTYPEDGTRAIALRISLTMKGSRPTHTETQAKDGKQHRGSVSPFVKKDLSRKRVYRPTLYQLLI